VPILLLKDNSKITTQSWTFDSLTDHAEELFNNWENSSFYVNAHGSEIMENGALVGEVVAVVPGSNLGMGMVRLEVLMNSVPDSKGFTLALDPTVKVLPYRPRWWRNLDAQTGKMARDI
jgi:hypothetical protein